ncbi:aldo/keto reductase [Jeotgalibaca caeni]|uniref:aldo/keto reductase n=1 Tax=Jeotgalibaca caeni TaxID=3028623 RepID=UPI00237EC7E3|nr:aldo/keto reductase [Jeotgalibaca caeni]MDE1549078.1 aldo/keto reductase [Jeotgalibaca caeni]
MKYNQLGNSGMAISELSFGTWAIGGDWGERNDEEALRALRHAIDQGVNFFDTADVYGNGHSEELLAQATKGKEDEIYIATKFIRKGDINDPENYTEEKIRAYCEASLQRLKRDRIDLYQVHCAPFAMLKETDLFNTLEKLKLEGKIRAYGVSVETNEEGLFVLENSNATALQVIFNVLRQKPLERLFPEAQRRGVGILARVPLASGLLTGKYTKDSTFSPDDHRNYNRDGQAFNVGETFGGLPFEKGVELVAALEWMKEDRGTLAQAALKWILEEEAVTSVIPGFRSVQQVDDNLASLKIKGYTNEERQRLQDFYTREVHQYIRGAYE